MTDNVPIKTPNKALRFLSFLKDKMPSPFCYLKSVIREDTQDRVAAFLAVFAGMALVIGFAAIVLAITVFKQKLEYELATISGSLVVLATFSKVDRDSAALPIDNKKKEDDN